MSDIPTEIYREILRRVPVESLFRFRSVCKTWRRIIDDPVFAKHHINRGIGGHWFFYRHDKGKIFLLPIKELSKGNNIVHATNVKTLGGVGVPRMRGFPVPSCNGLILLSSCKHNFVWRIWNPFTGESLEIGQCSEFPKMKGQYLHSPYSGIGYDEANDDYKVVRIVGFNTYLYSVNSKMWRKIGDFPDSVFGHENGVFADGALHWVAYSREQNGDFAWIAALDLSTGIYRKIALPSEVTQDTRRYVKLNALSGCLFLSCSNFKGPHFVAWMIKDYGLEDTWIKMISLENGNCMKPLAYLKSKGCVFLHFNRYQYLWYDVERSSAEMLSIKADADSFDAESDCHKYIYGHFSYQVFHASLIRFKRSDVLDESVASQGTSNRKRKRNMATTERLPLKILFGNPEDPPLDDEPAFNDDPAPSD